jgi:hypothetical protein
MSRYICFTNLKHLIFMNGGSKREGVGNFLSNNNIIAYASTFNKSLLGGVNVIMQMLFQSVG